MGTNLIEFKKTINEKFENLPKYQSIKKKGNCKYYNICVEHEGNNIAKASFTICQCEVGIISGLDVEEKFRKQGYGKKMLKYIERLMAIENGVRILALIPLPEAKGFWKKMGYMNVGENGMCKDIWKAFR